MYDFNWLALAAMAYQESGLDQTKRSRAGAVGIMQIKPSTAADRNVGVTGVDQLENNIHAATKYLAFLRDRYFSDPGIPDDARFNFSLAAYNAGPARIAGIRRQAEQQGYDPNRWFFDVETIAAAEIGRETVRYVSNINKYYVAYRLSYRGNLRRQLEMESMKRTRSRQERVGKRWMVSVGVHWPETRRRCPHENITTIDRNHHGRAARRGVGGRRRHGGDDHDGSKRPLLLRKPPFQRHLSGHPGRG
ncbi:MAG: transglycosylase SLT domain-containing protein [Thermoanaerobaculales bacterium]